VFVLVAAVQLVLGWTKSFPVSIGRPGLRISTHGIETLVILPLVVLLGARWGATGAAIGVLAGTVAFALVWLVVLARIHPEDVERPADLEESLAETQAETAALVR
jgi:O-antigen/teichoic acid export membrane protein